MKNRPAKVTPQTDLTSVEVVKEFRSAAKKLTSRATKSKRSARALLVSEGIYQKSGKLSKNYR